MIKDLRYPLKQRPFPQRTLVLAVPRRVGLWVGLVDFEVQVGLDLNLDLYFESGGTGRTCWLDLDFEVHSLIGLGLGLGLRGPTRIGLELGLGLRSPTRNWTWTSGPENRTLVKSAAAKSDFGFGLGLRALPWWMGTSLARVCKRR